MKLYWLPRFISDNKWLISTVFIACLLYTLPIIMADRNFIDDLGRSSQGYYNWSGNGRPFADLVMYILNFGGSDVDISPIPLFLSLVLYSISSVIYAKSLSNDASKPLVFIASMGAIINPFLLENLSYKYDVLPMIISMSILMIAFIHERSFYLRMLCGIISIIISLSSYQATIGMFVALSIIELIKLSYINTNARMVYQRVSERVFQLLVSYVIYSKFIQPIFIPASNGYTLKHSELLPLSQEGLHIFLRNLSIFSDRILSYAMSLPNLIIVFISISIVWSITLITLKIIGRKQLSWIPSVIIVFISPLLIITVSVIHLLALRVPITDPRVLISFSAVTMFVTSLHLIHGRQGKTLSTFAYIFLAFSFVYSYSYGNALKELKEYENFMTMDIASSIKAVDPESKLKIQTIGFMNYPNQVDLAIKKYPSIKNLLPRYLNNDWYWAFFQMGRYGIKNKRARLSKEKAISMSHEKETINKGDYSLIINHDVLLIKLKGTN